MWNGVPAPAMVTLCCWIISIGLRRVEALDVDGGEAVDERAEQPADAADVREREDHGVDVVLAEQPRRSLMPTDAGEDRAVGVLRALRVGRGARRVEVPADGVLAGIRRRRQGRRVALGQRLVGDEHLHRAARRPRAARRCHCAIASKSNPLHVDGTTSSFDLRLARDEADLALAVDREHRVLDRTQAGQREHEELRLEPGRAAATTRRRRRRCPCRASPAAARSAPALASAQVSVRPSSSTAARSSGVASARRSTSSQRLPPSTFGMLALLRSPI